MGKIVRCIDETEVYLPILNIAWRKIGLGLADEAKVLESAEASPRNFLRSGVDVETKDPTFRSAREQEIQGAPTAGKSEFDNRSGAENTRDAE
jgi:hypothetical protein